MLPAPPTVFPVYLRTSATPLVPSTSIQMPLTVPDDPAAWTLSIDVLLGVPDLLPLAAVIEAMHDAGCVAQKCPDDPRLD